MELFDDGPMKAHIELFDDGRQVDTLPYAHKRHVVSSQITELDGHNFSLLILFY